MDSDSGQIYSVLFFVGTWVWRKEWRRASWKVHGISRDLFIILR